MPHGEGIIYGKYQLLKRLATGGMGEIFLAKLAGQAGVEKFLVIKRILAHYAENQQFVDMFFAEARVTAQLHHPNIIQIYEMGQVGKSCYIAMEYCHGKSMRSILNHLRSRHKQLHPAYCIEIITQLCHGLSNAHETLDSAGAPLGVVHRDVTPHNILLSYDGQLKLIDFGIAKTDAATHQTETGTIKGKFVYMSPEQSAAQDIDLRSDIFSVGISLYEALTLVNPFARDNVIQSLNAIQTEEAKPVTDMAPSLAPFAAILDKALAKKPQERYQNCSALAQDLSELLATGKVDTPSQSLSAYLTGLFANELALANASVATKTAGETTIFDIHTNSTPNKKIATPPSIVTPSQIILNPHQPTAIRNRTAPPQWLLYTCLGLMVFLTGTAIVIWALANHAPKSHQQIAVELIELSPRKHIQPVSRSSGVKEKTTSHPGRLNPTRSSQANQRERSNHMTAQHPDQRQKTHAK